MVLFKCIGTLLGEATLLSSCLHPFLMCPFFLLRLYDQFLLTLLHSEQPKLHRVLAVLSEIGLRVDSILEGLSCLRKHKKEAIQVVFHCKNGRKHGSDHIPCLFSYEMGVSSVE